MKLLTWNISQWALGQDRIELVGQHLDRLQPDVIAFQEVPRGLDESLEWMLRAHGYPILHLGRQRMDWHAYGSAIASRLPITACPRNVMPSIPYPEMFAGATVHTAFGPVELLSVHIPNGSGKGWKKVETLERLRARVEFLRGPTIVAGDFNAPLHQLSNGVVVTAGQSVEVGGRLLDWDDWLQTIDPLLVRELADSATIRCWDSWTDDGVTASGRRWDQAERWFFEDSPKGGLQDAFRSIHGDEATARASTHRLKNTGTARRFDHIFVRGLTVRACEIDKGVAVSHDRFDHDPVWAEFEPGLEARE